MTGRQKRKLKRRANKAEIFCQTKEELYYRKSLEYLVFGKRDEHFSRAAWKYFGLFRDKGFAPYSKRLKHKAPRVAHMIDVFLAMYDLAKAFEKYEEKLVRNICQDYFKTRHTQ